MHYMNLNIELCSLYKPPLKPINKVMQGLKQVQLMMFLAFAGFLSEPIGSANLI